MREDMLALTGAVCASFVFGGALILLRFGMDLAVLAIFGEGRKGKGKRAVVREGLTLLFFILAGLAIPVFLFVWNRGILRLPMVIAFFLGAYITRLLLIRILDPILRRALLFVRHWVGAIVGFLLRPVLALLSLIWKKVTEEIGQICLRAERRYDTIRIGKFTRKKEGQNATEMKRIYRALRGK